jgi:hypothetical protein
MKQETMIVLAWIISALFIAVFFIVLVIKGFEQSMFNSCIEAGNTFVKTRIDGIPLTYCGNLTEIKEVVGGFLK